MRFFKTFLAATVIMIVLDVLWLGSVVNSFYLQQLDGLARIEEGKFVLTYWSAGMAYVVMALALTLFALPRVTEQDPWYTAAAWSGLLGFCLYGIYDFTNYATLLRWPLPFMAADLLWGTAQFAITAGILQVSRKILA